MSTVYNPEADVIADIERLELDARDLRRKLERAAGDPDRKVLGQLLKETEEKVEYLRRRVP